MSNLDYHSVQVRRSLRPLILATLPKVKGCHGTKMAVCTALLQQALLARACGLHLKERGEIWAVGTTPANGTILDVVVGDRIGVDPLGLVVVEAAHGGPEGRDVRLSLWEGDLSGPEAFLGTDVVPFKDPYALAAFENAAEVAP